MKSKAKAIYSAKEGGKEWKGKMKQAEGSMKCANCGSMKHMGKDCPEK